MKVGGLYRVSSHCEKIYVWVSTTPGDERLVCLLTKGDFFVVVSVSGFFESGRRDAAKVAIPKNGECGFIMDFKEKCRSGFLEEVKEVDE